MVFTVSRRTVRTVGKCWSGIIGEGLAEVRVSTGDMFRRTRERPLTCTADLSTLGDEAVKHSSRVQQLP